MRRRARSGTEYNDGLLKARKALREIINVLGPNDYTCPNCCEGCQVEMQEALHTAKRALS